MTVVGLIDDNPDTHGRTLHGVPVLGGTDRLAPLVQRYDVRLLVIAIRTATAEQTRRIVERCRETGVEFKIIPSLDDLLARRATIAEVRDVQIEDLLGRDPVELDLAQVKRDLAGKSILVTGGAGAIGSELARQIASYEPKRLVLLERAESPLYFTHLEVAGRYPGVEVVPFIGSITNPERLAQVFELHRPDYVFHTAAYKHVPMLEANAVEAVWNNVFGTLRVAECAALHGVEKFVLISTDKAVSPSSMLGATKRIGERIVLELPSLIESQTDFRAVRFGNVLGSDGSVVPVFKRQISVGGPVRVTHPDVRRYFMTIPEAVQLVLKAAALPEAARRIAILEMGRPVRIVDLAEQLIRLSGLVPYRDIQIVFTGLRPGEKLAEELVACAEDTVATSVDKIRVIQRNGADGPAVERDLEHLLKITLHRRPVRSVALDDADLVDGGGDGVLGARHELFGEFLAGAESGERDLNVAVGLEARQPDQLLRELEDADRLAHLENRDAAFGLGQGGRLEHQRGRLGDRHEVAGHLGVRHLHRPAGADMPLEQRNDAPVRAQHVAEPDGAEIGGGVTQRRQLQHDPLADALGGPEHAGRVHGLVRRDQHELLDAVQGGAFSDPQRAEHVVPHGLRHVALEHRHVLVGRGMEHVVRPVQPEHLLQPVGVGDAADERHHFDLGIRLGDLEVGEVERVLGTLEQHQPRRPVGRDLARQLRADRAGPAGHEDRLARQVALDLFQLKGHRFAAQQVVDLDIAQLADREIGRASCRERVSFL